MFGIGRRKGAWGVVRGRRSRPLAVEQVEGRTVPAASGATILLSGGMVEVLGSNLGDTATAAVQNGAVVVRVANAQGTDVVSFPAARVSSVYFRGGSGSNNFTNATGLTGYLFGGSGDNVLNGGSGRDYLFATGSGNDTLNAGSGVETLQSYGTGTNALNGGSGTSTLYAYAGVNRITGGTGTTTVFAYGGHNVIDGGPGVSTVYSFSKADVIIPEAHETVFHVGY